MTEITLRDAEKYVGTPYIDGEFDCASLAVLVQRELFGREIKLPHAGSRRRGQRGNAADIEQFKPQLADKVETPMTGDFVIMWEVTGHGEPPLNRRWHIGTVFVQDGDRWILHCANETHGTLLQRLGHLLDKGMNLDGFYAWRVSAPQTLSLAIKANPIEQQVERRITPAGRTLAETLAAEGVTGPDWFVRVGGRLVPREMWHLTRVKPGNEIEAQSRLRKSALSLVAIAVLSYFTAGIASGAYAGALGAGTLAAGSTGALFAAGAVSMGGSMLINKLLSPKVSSAGDNTGNAPPPTYSLQGGRNRARPYESLALVLGECKMVPDNANNPFSWFDGDEQYLSTMFHAGINCGSVSNIKLGANPIEQYEGVRIDRYGFPGINSSQPPALGNSVDTVEGALLDAPNGGPGIYATRTTSKGTSKVGIDLEFNLTYMNEKGRQEPIGVTVDIDYRALNGVWVLGSFPFSNSTNKPIRRTLMFDMPVPGQYEFRLRKVTPNVAVTGAFNAVTWSLMKSYQPDLSDYGSQARVNVTLKATGQLSGAPDEINWIARADVMPIWDGSQWRAATEPGAGGLSNPGAQILMLLRGIFRAKDGRRIAGAGLADNRIDIQSFQAFMVRCAQKNFRFDAIIQETMNLQDLLESIAAAGLGTLSRHSGKWGIVYMSESEPISGVVNMTLMQPRSFAVQYDLMATADEYSLEYFDRNLDYTWQPVRVKAPGTGTPQRTATENIRGVTTAEHAALMARFAMGQNIYGRKTITFDLDLVYLTFRRGMVLALSHDLTQWGYSGSVRAVTILSSGFVVEVDEPVPTESRSIQSLGLRLPGEMQMRVFPITAVSADGRQLTTNISWPAGAQIPGQSRPAKDTKWIYDFKATPGYRVRVIGIEPADDMAGAQLTVVPETPEFWNYVLNGEYVPPPNNSLISRELPVASNLRITRSRVPVGNAWVHELTAMFDVRGSYASAQLWAAPLGSTLSLVPLPPIYGTQVTWQVPADRSWTIEIRPFDSLGRLGTAVSETFIDPSEIVVGVTAFFVRIEDVGAVAHWTPPQGLDGIAWAETEIREGATWETATKRFSGRTDRANLGWLKAGTRVFWAANRNSANDLSTPQSFAIVIEAPFQPVVSGRAIRDQVELTWQDCTRTQPIDVYEVKIGPRYEGAGVATRTPAIGYVRTETTAAKRLYWVTPYDKGGNAGAPGYKELETLPGIDEALQQLQAGIDKQINDVKAIALQSGYIRANLLYNGGFEQGKDGWTTTDPDGFDIGGEFWGTYAVIKTPRASDQIYGRSVKALPNQRFTGSADMAFLSSTGEATLHLQFKNSSGAILAETVGAALKNADFSDDPARRESLAVDGLAPAGTASATLVMVWTGYSGSGAVALRYAKIELGARPSTVYTTETSDQWVGGAVRQVIVDNDATAEKLGRSYTLAVSQGRRVTGMRAYADGSESILTFFGDRVAFAIGDLDAPKYLMTLGFVNGTPSLGVDGNFYLDGAFKARMIDSDQIYGRHIIADTLETRHHKAGSITADLINVGAGTNIVPNATLTERPGAQGNANGWTVFENVLGAVFGTNFSSTYNLKDGVSGYIQQANQNYNGFPIFERNAQTSSPPFNVMPNTRYEFHARLVAHRCTATVLIQFLDFQNNVISNKAAPIRNLPGGNGIILADYLRVGDFAISPPNAASAIITILKSSTLTGFPDSYLFWTQPFVAEATPYQTALSPYSPSGLGTKITPQGITTPNLAALSGDMGALNAGQVTINGDATNGGGYGFIRSPGKWFDGSQGWILARGANGDAFVDFTTGGFYFRMRSGPVETVAVMDWGGIYMDSTGRLEIRKNGVISTPNMTGGAVTSYSYAEFPPDYVFYAQGDSTPELGLFNVSSEGGFIVFEITAIASPNSGPDTGGGD